MNDKIQQILYMAYSACKRLSACGGIFKSQIIIAYYLENIIETGDDVPHISNVWGQQVHETIKSQDVQAVCNIFTAYSSAVFVIYCVHH